MNQKDMTGAGSAAPAQQAFADQPPEFESVSFQVAPQLRLAGDAIGPTAGETVLLIHGIGQTRGAWARVAPHIAALGFRVVSIDLRGHGDSDWAQDGDYSLDGFGHDVRAVMAQLGGRPLVVGASLGGLSTVLAAGESPAIRPEAVVLVDIVPWIDAAEGSHVRQFMRGTADGFDTVEAAADAVQQYLPHRPRPRSTEGLMKNLRPTVDGRLRWHWDPRIVAPRDDWDISRINDRLRAAAQAMAMPIMLLRGTRSEIVSEIALDRFRDILPDAEIVEIADARHMVVGDDNGGFLSAARDFLLRHSSRERSVP